MKKRNRIISSFLVIALVFMALSMSVSARNYSSYYNSPSCVAGTEYSCRNSQTANLTSQYPEPDSGNAGVYFYVSSVGLSNETYVWDTTREVTVKLYEDDAWNSDDYVCKYTGTFVIRTNTGLYQPSNWWRTDPNDVVTIEDTSNLELYITICIEVRAADTSHNIPQGLLLYRIWAD